MAGDVLLRVVVLGHIGDSEPSVRKALFSLRNFAIGLRSDENGEQLEGREFKAIPDTEESLRHYWSQYRAVAHFWAAHRVLEQIVPFFEIPAALSEDALLQQFLGHSEWFLQFGLGKTSRNDKVGTLLELAGMWVCRPRPDALEPELEYAVASVQEQVKDYRAH